MTQQLTSREQVEQSARFWLPRIVHLRAAVTGLDTPFISFAVLKNDPIPNFRRYVESGVANADEQDAAIVAVENAWNEPLASLGSDKRFFLFAWSSVPGASPRLAQVAGLSIGIATRGPKYKRWITSSAVRRQGEIVAWCEELDMHGVQEEMVEVVLTEERMFRLMDGVSAGDARVSNNCHV